LYLLVMPSDIISSFRDLECGVTHRGGWVPYTRGNVVTCPLYLNQSIRLIRISHHKVRLNVALSEESLPFVR